jgi:hypothetical protein
MICMNELPQIVTKGRYAVLKNVTPSRVSQWIADGKIDGAALVGEGRNAQIAVAIADQQLRDRLDLSQRLGNGLSTRLTPDADPDGSSSNVIRFDPIEEQLKREKLEAVQRENRKRAEEEAARTGRYVLAQAASAQMAKIAGWTWTVVDGALPEIASAIASKFSLPQRDALHLLRNEIRSMRQRAAATARAAAAEMPALVEDRQAGEADEIEVSDV